MKRFTFAYHMAEVTNWAAIQRDGLHPASTLLEISGVTEYERENLNKSQRLAHIELPDGVEIRDQRPMPPKALQACLIGMTPGEWYALINEHVFFWLDPERLNRHRAACNARPQIVATVDADRLIHAYADKVELTPINTGNARRKPARRGAATFVPYSIWKESGWAIEAESLGGLTRSRSHIPVELTVRGSIPDVMNFVVDVQELAPGQTFSPPGIDLL